MPKFCIENSIAETMSFVLLSKQLVENG